MSPPPMENYDHLAGITRRKQQTRSVDIVATNKVVQREGSGVDSLMLEPRNNELDGRRAKNRRRKAESKKRKERLE